MVGHCLPSVPVPPFPPTTIPHLLPSFPMLVVWQATFSYMPADLPPSAAFPMHFSAWHGNMQPVQGRFGGGGGGGGVEWRGQVGG